MSISFLANNLVDSATLTASTENAQFPVSNLKNDFRTKVFRSTSNSDNIVIDLGAAAAADSFGIVDNWRDGFGVTAITLEGNSADSWGAPAFTTTIALDTTFGVGVKTFAEQSYRYWRIVATSTLGYCELANVFLGKANTITTNGPSYNWSYRNKDIKSQQETRYGQKFIDNIGQRKELSNFKFEVLNQTELQVLFDVFDNRRTVSPLFLKIGDGTNVILPDEDRVNGMYYFDREPSFSNTTAGFYSVTLNFEEAK
jgi:hypothetical protein